jgi:hypothetical protein
MFAPGGRASHAKREAQSAAALKKRKRPRSSARKTEGVSDEMPSAFKHRQPSLRLAESRLLNASQNARRHPLFPGA